MLSPEVKEALTKAVLRGQVCPWDPPAGSLNNQHPDALWPQVREVTQMRSSCLMLFGAYHVCMGHFRVQNSWAGWWFNAWDSKE